MRRGTAVPRLSRETHLVEGGTRGDNPDVAGQVTFLLTSLDKGLAINRKTGLATATAALKRDGR